MEFHDLTPGRQLPPATKLVLGLSLKFVPGPEAPTTRKSAMEAFERLENDLGWKVHFAGEEQTFKPSKMYVKSNLRAPLPPPKICLRINDFERYFKRLFGNRPKMKSNLPGYLERLLLKLRDTTEIIFALADKNLGPVAVTLEQYIEDGLVHLMDTSTYEIISEQEALKRDKELRTKIRKWIMKHAIDLPQDVRQFLRSKLSKTEAVPFGYFYLLYKIHKTPVKTRPVCSDCASTTHALGIWVDSMLQPIVKSMPAYFKDSFELTKILKTLNVQKGWSIFSFDAISVYTNIDTQDCISRLSNFLLDPETIFKYPHYPAKALVEALILVMQNNRMRFGDIIAQQLAGIAMGMAPAPAIANIYVALYEKDVILPRFKLCLPLYLRFIDDGLAVWKHNCNSILDAQLLSEFKDTINASGLKWTFTKPDQKVVFMDLNISMEKGAFSTNLYEKPLALHLYIPPHSCHPPGCFSGLIRGMVLRIYRLCSKRVDRTFWLKEFYGHLLDRGYPNSFVLPAFKSAVKNAISYISTSDEYRLQQKAMSTPANTLYLHLKYNPADPSSKQIQKLWRDLVARPANKPHLHHLRNDLGEKTRVSRLIIAYSRHLNIGNLLSYRKICNRPGLKVSSFMD